MSKVEEWHTDKRTDRRTDTTKYIISLAADNNKKHYIEDASFFLNLPIITKTKEATLFPGKVQDISYLIPIKIFTKG